MSEQSIRDDERERIVAELDGFDHGAAMFVRYCVAVPDPHALTEAIKRGQRIAATLGLTSA